MSQGIYIQNSSHPEQGGVIVAAYLKFGILTRAAIALIKKHGGEFKAGYALLGEVDFLVILDLPNAERAKLAVA